MFFFEIFIKKFAIYEFDNKSLHINLKFCTRFYLESITFKTWSKGRSFLIQFRKYSASWNTSFRISLLKSSTLSIWRPTRLLLAWTAGTGVIAVVRRFGLLSLLYLVILLIGNGETVLCEGSALECSLVSISTAKCTFDLCDPGCRRCASNSNKQ